MTTTFEADLDLTTITKHPNNPRRRAAADDDLVESVRANGLIEPLIVVPTYPSEYSETYDRQGGHAPVPSGYLLIAGHRRLDACKKAKHTTAPAIVRTDLKTPGQQLEAMLVENDNREDLTPIEQAAGYQQLQLEFGYTQTAIAKAVGKDAKTVRARLQLLKLAKPTQKKVHDGQLALDDALALVEFADDKAATKRLESELNSSYGNFKHRVASERRMRKEAAAVEVQVAELVAHGVPEHRLPAGETTWNMSGARRISNISVPEEEHTECLAWVRTAHQSYSSPEVLLVCTDVARHNDQMEDADRKRLEELERERAEYEAEKAAATTAQTLRIQSVRELGCGASLTGTLRAVVRSLLPGLLTRLDDIALKSYLDAMVVPDDNRWENRWYDDAQCKRNEPKLIRHLAEFDRWTDADLTTALVTVLAAVGDDCFAAQSYRKIDTTARRYYELLETAEYSFSDVDLGIAGELATDPLGAELAAAEQGAR